MDDYWIYAVFVLHRYFSMWSGLILEIKIWKVIKYNQKQIK